MRRSYLCLFFLFCVACPAPATEPDCTMTVLPACATGPDRYSDEACQALDDALGRSPAAVDAMRSAVVESPMEGAMLPAATPATFRWRTPLTAFNQQIYTPIRTPSPRAMTFWDELQRWTTLLPEAHAHCMPYNGLGFSLLFRSNGRTVLRVEQSATSYTPDAIAWDTLRSAGTIDLTILTARFRESAVSEGPFAPERPVRFTIR